MKKLLFITYAILLITKSLVNAQSPCSLPGFVDNNDISLNGILIKDALPKISYFQQNIGKFTAPHQQSVWYDRDNFHKMIVLIDKENANSNHTPKDSIDGIRIYFASDNTLSDIQNLFIVLVSTKQGNPKSAPSKFEHIDFSKHDLNDPLFSDRIVIRGQARERKLLKVGERLYSRCTNCQFTLPCTAGEHYIDRDKAERMVGTFGEGAMLTCSEWFDLRLLRALDQEPNHTGYRFYFAKHGNDEVDVDQEVKNKDAFIIVATTRGMWPFRHNVDNFDCLPSTLALTLGKYKSTRGFWLFGGGPGGQDNGELCPANCNP